LSAEIILLPVGEFLTTKIQEKYSSHMFNLPKNWYGISRIPEFDYNSKELRTHEENAGRRYKATIILKFSVPKIQNRVTTVVE